MSTDSSPQTAQPVDTRRAERRELHFNNFADLLAEAERLAEGEVVTTGNWTFGQILDHLSKALNATIDGVDIKVSWPMRMMGRLMKKRFLTKGIPPGFKIPEGGEQFEPEDEITVETGLQRLRDAIERIESTDERAEHVVFGPVPKEIADTFQLRHAEMHLGFVRRA